jgi:hypothetical protein
MTKSIDSDKAQLLSKFRSVDYGTLSRLITLSILIANRLFSLSTFSSDASQNPKLSKTKLVGLV